MKILLNEMKAPCLGIIIILMITITSSLGVTPARATIDFESNLEQSITVTVIGDGSKNDMSISVSGELAEYITLSKKKLIFKKGEESKTFSYELSFPSSLEPGLHTAKVIILEDAKNNDREVVQATLAVATQIHVEVPFPGKYAKSKIYIEDKGKDTIQFIIPVVSAGEYDLIAVRANIDIINALGEKIDSLNTKTITIPSGKKKELAYDWKVNVPVGNYLAVVTLIYDGETQQLEKTFKVGDKILDLQEIRADNFNLGSIAKFEMLVENKWSESLDDVHIDTKIFDEREQILSHFKSSVETIAAFSKKVFISYWDTAGFTEGIYRTEVAINYGNASVKKSLEFEVKQNELNVIGLGYVISSGGGSSGSSNLVTILISVVVILILVNLLWFLILRKRLKKK